MKRNVVFHTQKIHTRKRRRRRKEAIKNRTAVAAATEGKLSSAIFNFKT